MSAMERDCLICGQMMCGCAQCRSGHSFQARFGICLQCAVELSNMSGERHSQQGDVLRATGRAPQHTYDRIKAMLIEWSRP